ncbi:protein PAM71-homolog, chloroplastic-like isoform X2 [Salvia splendens]|uniref:protein PAM71-homolog, chloroplastic-like isoform X2 n=1 Tax=Salvia splendens TaxID=180675 RepID=UPI001C25579E|nr:protein PAM71-homolog, chloroplastic-like isoform X2 [Salvia splendens]
MQVLAFQTPQILSSTTYKNALPLSGSITTLPFSPLVPRKITRSSTSSLQYREAPKDAAGSRLIRSHALNVGAGSGSYDEGQGNDSQSSLGKQHTETSSKLDKSPDRIPYLFPIAVVLCSCTLAFLLILLKRPTSILPALAKSGFTAAFSLIFVSEIGDKTFFIAALLAMQYDKLLVLLGSVGALSLMTVLSVIIGRIFHSVPAQFQTTLPIGEYAAVTLLVFFGLKAIKDAWDLPSAEAKTGESSNQESVEFTEAEELVKEKASKRLSNPLEVIWKSFSLVFFAEWGDRSMLATIALGAAQSPWGVASGAIVGHLIATSLAILGGALLAKYISEKLVGYVGGVLFIVFGIATFFGAF